MNQKKKIDFKGLAMFVRANWLRIVLRGALSLCVAGALFALYMAFAPCSKHFAVEVQLTLESRDGELHYPNGQKFSAHDIISAPVLNIIWKTYGLDAKGVKFEDFCQWFGIVSYNKERAKVDAEFQGKMSKRNITMPELVAVQKEYEERLASLSVNRFVLSMRPTGFMDSETAVKMLNDIPKTWFAEYSRLKAPLVPSVAAGETIKSYVECGKGDGGRVLELLDVLRLYMEQVMTTCDYIRNGLMKGRNASVDGVDLGTYEANMLVLKSEILRLKYRVLTGVSAKELAAYVDARIEDMACEELNINEKIAAVNQALEAFGIENRRTKAIESAGTEDNGLGKQNPVTIQVDAGFFADFAAMIRRDANQALVRKYAGELTDYKKQLADIASRKLYYDQIRNHEKVLSAGEMPTKEDSSVVYKEVVSLAGEILNVGEKIVAFRDLCFSVYRTSDQFFAIAAPAAYERNYVLPLPRFAIGLVALWILYNLMFVVKIWNKAQD